jgi:FtsH-binding integral membrane protein
MRKALLLFLAAVFAAFAALNLNDPDPELWVTVYAVVAGVFLLAAFGRTDRRVSGLVALLLAVWMATMAQGMLEWARMGFPTITGSMKAEEPHIEVVREFLGLLIAVLALSGLALTTRRSG